MTETKLSSMTPNRGNLDAPELKWEDTITAVRKYRLRSPKRVALCGFASSSRHLAPYDNRSVEIWSCNESYNANFMKTSEGKFRADLWFQMHLEEDWGRRNNPNDPRHPEWLAREHNFPIMMQEKFDKVPNAKAFPLKECDEMFFSNVWTIDTATLERVKWLDKYEHGYYTSSFAWMIAYALWQQKWDIIEIFGFNMGTQSEYLHQKPGGEFWVGQAMGLGVGIAPAGNSPIMQGAMYGYEIADVLLPTMLTNRTEELKQDLLPLKDQAQQQHGARLMLEALSRDERYKLMHEDLVRLLRERHQEELVATSRVNFYAGAEFITDRYLHQLKTRHSDGGTTGWIDRLTLEVQKSKAQGDIDEVKEYLDNVAGAKAELERNLALYTQDPEAEASWKLRMDKLINKEVALTGQLSFLLGQLSQIQQFTVILDARNANMTDERGFGHIIVPDLYGISRSDPDVLKLGVKNGKKRKEESKEPETNNGGTETGSGKSGESA